MYWGRNNITSNRVRYEFNRPFLEAKDYQDDDALAVEATSYALLTMFLIEGGGVTVIQDQVTYIYQYMASNLKVFKIIFLVFIYKKFFNAIRFNIRLWNG